MADKGTVVILGTHVGAVGVVRALAPHGLKLVVLSYYKGGMAHRSRHVSEWHEVPHPRDAPEAFIAWLQRHADRWPGALIVETDDHGAVALSKHKEALSENYRIGTPDWQRLRVFVEKDRAAEACRNAGVPHPVSFIPTDSDDLGARLPELKLPCILKPIRSHEFVGAFHTKLFQVETEKDLLEKFALCEKEKQVVMVQEIVPGADTNIWKCMTYINQAGEMAGMFFYDKIRQNPPQFGVMRVGTSRPSNPQIRTYAESLLRETDYRGVCTVEFRRDPRTDELKFIEVNARMPRMNWLASFSGVNFPWILYSDIVRNEQIQVPAYNEHAYWIDLMPDLLYTLTRRSHEPSTWSEYLAPYRGHHTFAVWSAGDPMPFLTQLAAIPGRLLRRAGSP